MIETAWVQHQVGVYSSWLQSQTVSVGSGPSQLLMVKELQTSVPISQWKRAVLVEVLQRQWTGTRAGHTRMNGTLDNHQQDNMNGFGCT
jgi:hypothetical protein